MSDNKSLISLIEDARETRKDVLWDRYTEADDKPFDDLIKLCKRAERYRWHDLRKNPEDLPELNKRVLFYTIGFSDVAEQRYWTGDYIDERFYNDDFEEYMTRAIYKREEVIAWREIEPFMEVEAE